MATATDKKSLVLIDGHSLAYRMYFALEHTRMQTSSNEPIWAVYGFFNAIFALLKNIKPDAIAMSFDVSSITFRNEMYSEYKAHREKMPDELRDQIDRIKEGIATLGIPIYELQNYEADDVIGTLSKQAAEDNWHVKILTGDQDSFQLVHDGGNGKAGAVEILIPDRSPRNGLKTYDTQAVFEKLGVYPDQVIDYKGLRGDTSDNIPGVPGVGPKTAVKFLTEYKTLENLYEHLDDLPKNKMLEKLVVNHEQAVLSKKLATIDRDAPIKVNLDDCHLVIPDVNKVIEFFEACEFKQFLKQAPTILAPFVEGEMPTVEVPEKAPAKKASATGNTDLKDILEDVASPIDVKHHVVTSEVALKAVINEIKNAGVFAVDLETTGLDVFNDTIVGIAISVNENLSSKKRKAENILNLNAYPSSFPTLCQNKKDAKNSDKTTNAYIPVGHLDTNNGESIDQLPLETVIAALKPILEDENIIKIVHNAKFEQNMFESAGIHWQGLVFDTMIASYVYQPERKHGLKSLGFDMFKFTMTEIEELIGKGKKQIPFSEVPVEKASPYAVSDSFVTLKLAETFVDRMDEEQITLFYEVEMPLAHVLGEMERTGVALDLEYLKTLSKELDEKIETAQSKIYELAGEEFNVNSPKQVGEILFDKMGITPLRKTKGKTGYSTDVKVLEMLSDEHEIVDYILEYRQLFKLKSTYVDALPELVNSKTGRIHTSYNQTVTATGRLSSSAPNLQNIPIRSDLGRQIRRAFVPKKDAGEREGWSLLAADYSQIELRLLAHFSEDPNLVEAFKNGEDIHSATAALVFGLDKDKVTKALRYKAKAVNFGVIYGQTAHGLSQALKIPRAEAAEFIDRYFFKYKKVKGFIDSVKAQAHETGKVSTICGRTRNLSEGLNSSNRNIREFSERAAFNTPLQGSASDLMKVAMIRLQNALKDKNMESRLILQVHDEVVLEVPDNEKDAIQELVQWSMELAQPLKVPLVVDMSMGPTWMES